MAKGKDFYGDNVTGVIAKACKDLSASQEELDIEVLETGSAGIFGLCKKKAHIRVTRKNEKSDGVEKKSQRAAEPVAESPEQEVDTEKKETPAVPAKTEELDKAVELKQPDRKTDQDAEVIEKQKQSPAPEKKKNEKKVEKNKTGKASAGSEESVPRELPSDEVLVSINEEITSLLEVMGFPSTVTVLMDNFAVVCQISDEHQEAIVGRDGRTLDSLQYLLRKMMSRRLPDRMMLSLDVGNYRERRGEELKDRALELAGQVKEDGKTQAIAALNPSERRVVHMVLQEDKAIRSRSVGEGLFKKVLIYKPGKKKSGSRKGKGRQGGRSSGNK